MRKRRRVSITPRNVENLRIAVKKLVMETAAIRKPIKYHLDIFILSLRHIKMETSLSGT